MAVKIDQEGSMPDEIGDMNGTSQRKAGGRQKIRFAKPRPNNKEDKHTRA